MDFNFPLRTLRLNEEQAQAVLREPHCNQRIIASAGSGKTTTLTARIAWLLCEHQVKPESIVLMTFSRNAAQQMIARIENLVGPARIWAGTFHGLARTLLSTFDPGSLGSLYFVDELIGMGTQWLTTPKGRAWVGKIRYIVVDEFQDINAAQWKMVERMMHPGAKLLVVGDDAQNIYTWRGSDVKFILQLEKKLTGLVDDQLRINYRSSDNIIAAANAVMKFIPTLPWKKSMIGAGAVLGRKPDIHFFWRMKDETRWILTTIQGIQALQPKLTMAILSRTNLDLFRCEEEFLTAGIPYRLRDCGKMDEEEKEGAHGVDLVTLHASKGLEWDIVFMLHCNDDVFPSSKKKEDVICERRLFYVAVTRARKHLFLTYNRNERELCRFIREIPSRYLTYHGLARYCLSEAELTEGMPTLEHLIGSLDGDDFKQLRVDGILSWLELRNIRETNLFPPGEIWALPRWATKPEVARDFFRFLKTFVRRQIAKKSSDAFYRDPVSERLLFTLRIFSEDRAFWETWRDELLQLIFMNFQGDEAAKVPPPVEYAMVAEWCKRAHVEWTAQEILAATTILAKIRGQLRPLRYESYELNEFTVAPCRFSVPTELRGEILRSWRAVTKLDKASTEILEDIWRIGALQVVAEGRNAPLFRVSQIKESLKDTELGEFLQMLESALEDWSQTSEEWQVGLEVESEWVTPEGVDLYSNGCMWRIAGEEKERISSMKLLLLAITAGLAQKQGMTVHTIGMVYPLEGRCLTIRLPTGWCESVDVLLLRCRGV
jgi:hypothetical protein